MKAFRVSTVTLVFASTEVQANDAEDALEQAQRVPPSQWDTGGVFGDVDLEGECVEVVEVGS